MRKINLFRELIGSGLSSLRGHGMRTFLTMLGISFGIFTITGILTLVDSLQYTITKNLSALGNTVMFVHNWPWKDNSNDWHRFINRPKVSYQDFMKLKENLGGVEGVSYGIRAGSQTLKYEGSSLSGVDMEGVTQDYGALYNLDIEEGRYFSPVETESGRPVIILGYNVALTLMGQPPWEGSAIDYRGHKIRVIGIIKKQGTSMFGSSIDDRAYIPYTWAAKLFNLNSRRLEKVITVKAKHYEDMPLIEGEIIGLMRQVRGLKPSVEDNFSVNKQEMLMNQVGEIFKYLSIGGFIISLFSILVGGFGIGNIMYASVKERTFEIGLMKAVGATRGYVMSKFIIEAIMMCLVGGAVGLMMLFGFATIARQIIASADMNFSITLSMINILYGVAISAGIGLISGFLPALFASRLDPVETLRAK